MASSLILHPVEQCVFCTFLSGAWPFTIVHRNDVVAVMVTREQRGIGHLLVVPTAHRETILDLTPDEGTQIMAAVIACSRAVLDAYHCAGLAVWQNNGAAAHQRVPHVHFHVAGTLPQGGTHFDDVPRLTQDDTDLIADQIRPFLTL
jgi:histidine triad (HIT) family protein